MTSFYSGNRPQFLEQLVRSGRLTPDGRDWLTLALDPFHDTNHQAAGYPDTDGSQTIVSCFQYQTDVVAPVGVVGNWDAHIYNLPVCESELYKRFSEPADRSSMTAQSDVATFLQGPLCINTAAAGMQIVPTNAPDASSTFRSLPAAGVQDLCDGITRIIGIGFEVTNTTAEMYKQGSVTCYRMPQYPSQVASAYLNNAAGTVKGSASVQMWQSPPASTSQANLLKGTRTWDASAGVYATVVQNAVQNQLVGHAHNVIAFSDMKPVGIANNLTLSPYAAPVANAAPAVSVLLPDYTKTAPFDTTGAIFSGLSNSTTLTVKVRFYVERAPSYAEPSLSVLATPSAGYDTVALELYSQAISQLPVAVTVAENGLGDWFKGVLNVLKTVAGGAGRLLGPIVPGASQVGSAAQTILGTVSDWIPASKKNPVAVPRPLAINSAQQIKKKVAKTANQKRTGPIARMIARQRKQ